MPSADVPSAERSNGDTLSAATYRCRLNSMISPLELIDSTTECRALCMEKHGMPVRPIMATAACAVLVTQGRAPAGGRLGTPRATGTESQNSKHAVLCALTARISWARSRRTVPIFVLSESAPQKGGRLNRTSPVTRARGGENRTRDGRAEPSAYGTVTHNKYALFIYISIYLLYIVPVSRSAKATKR